jgi:hypothetical protein
VSPFFCKGAYGGYPEDSFLGTGSVRRYLSTAVALGALVALPSRAAGSTGTVIGCGGVEYRGRQPVIGTAHP